MLATLPPKYYLAHAQELFGFVAVNCSHLLSNQQQNYLQNYTNLSEDGQCLLIRLLSRKPKFVNFSSLLYDEITDLDAAIKELSEFGFVSVVKATDWLDFLPILTKPQLVHCLKTEQIHVTASMPKTDLLSLAIDSSNATQHGLLRQQFLVRRQQDCVDYILFLFFGDLRNRLQKFAMRDLGVIKTRKADAILTARFESKDEANSAFRLQQLRREFELNPDLQRDAAAVYLLSTPPVGPSAELLSDKLLFDVATKYSRNKPERAIELWKASSEPQATERWIRETYSYGDRELLKLELQQLREVELPAPSRIFVEDFYARKYQGKRTSIYTDLLRETSNKLSIDEVYLNDVEEGVMQLYRQQGLRVFFTENKLWRVLFAFTFWSLLYGKDKPRVNEFENLPLSLRRGRFYSENTEEVERCLALLDSPDKAIANFTTLAARYFGSPTGLFRWNSKLLDPVRPCLALSAKGSIASVLRRMAQDFKHTKDGYPDLMVANDNALHFEEVKAPGDSLRPNQLVSINRLRRAGMQVQITQIDWATDPNQVYAVVDIETTGGRKGGNAITEIAVVKMCGKEIVGEWSTLINPQRHIPGHITQLTGINNQMVADAPLFSEIADELETQLHGAIFVAHNVGFDYGFINAAYQSIDRTFSKPKICTVRKARKVFPGLKSYSLGNLTEHFDIELESHHRALSDARATAELLILIQQQQDQALTKPKSLASGI